MPSDAPAPPAGWQAIRDEALRRIRAREWPPGAPIPNEAELAAEFGCARATVNRALRDLAAEGLIERRRKAGSRVAPHPLRRATFEIPLIRQEVEARGGRYGYALINRHQGPAPVPVSSRMGLPPGAGLLHLQALHLADSSPYMYEDRWVNPQAAPSILAVDLSHTSANAWLVQNMPYTHGEIAFSAAPADGEPASALGCAPGAALFCMERITWIDAAPVTFVTQYYAPGHRLMTAI